MQKIRSFVELTVHDKIVIFRRPTLIPNRKIVHLKNFVKDQKLKIDPFWDSSDVYIKGRKHLTFFENDENDINCISVCTGMTKMTIKASKIGLAWCKALKF